MLVIIDYGVGNLASIQNMVKKTGAESVISGDSNIIEKASKIILPGVGHFDNCMNMFNASGLRDVVTKKALDEKIPVLGICVGFQMLMESSEEGDEIGLGWVSGKVVKFDQSQMPAGYKIPHMGWTDVQPAGFCRLYEGIQEPRFYFVHSYHVNCDNQNEVSAMANYGYPFAASVEKNNIMGVQFHPEKSHKFGMNFYENFIKFF
jgi:imidazole glycerol-phosphate synthase subunit HisH